MVNSTKVDYFVTSTSSLKGEIKVPGDKSISHRALMLSAVAEGNSILSGLLTGQDNLATLAALEQLGVNFKFLGEHKLEVQGVGLHGLHAAKKVLDLQNSGTGIRLLTGLLAGQVFDSELSGDESLRKRPMARIVDPLNSMGAQINPSTQGTAPLKVKGGQKLHGIHYKMPIASAQVKSSLLFAAMYAEGETIIQESHASRDHTERMMKSLGYPLNIDGNQIQLHGFHPLHAIHIQIPGDISSAAFFIVAALITPGSELVIKDVGINPTRVGIIQILKEMGACIELLNPRNFGSEPVADIYVRHSKLHGIEIDSDLVPSAIDEFPIIFIAAACAEGQTSVHNALELRVKESDRIAVMSEGLNQLGIQSEVLADGLIINGGQIKGGHVESHKDHRIAMAFAVAGCVATRPISISECAFVETSFPGFVELANSIGFRIRNEY